MPEETNIPAPGFRYRQARRVQLLLVGILAASAALRLVLAFRTVPVDDAYITLRYARNLAAGHGLVYHAGDPVFALCGPLYAVLLSLAFRTGADVVKLLPVGCILFDLAAIWVAYRLAARAAGPPAGLLAAACCGFFPWQALACGYGMETQMFQFLVLGALAAAAEERWNVAAAAAGLAVLTRPEGVVVSVLVAVAYGITRRTGRRSPSDAGLAAPPAARPAALSAARPGVRSTAPSADRPAALSGDRSTAPSADRPAALSGDRSTAPSADRPAALSAVRPAAPPAVRTLFRRGSFPRAHGQALLLWGAHVVPWIIGASVFYGSPVPTSIVAKSRRHVSLGAVVDYLATGNPFLLLLWIGAAIGMFVVVRRLVSQDASLRVSRGSDPPGRQPGIGPFLCGLWALAYAAEFLAGRPSFLGPWYRPALQGALSVCAAVGIARVSERSRNPVISPVRALGFCAIAWTGLCALAVPRVLATARLQRSMAESIYLPLSFWCRDHSVPGDSIMAGDIGHVGYFSERSILDLGGLVTPSILRTLRAHPAAGKTGVSIALARRPRIFLAADRPENRSELEDADFLAAYRLAAEFPPEDVPPPAHGGLTWRTRAYLLREAAERLPSP